MTLPCIVCKKDLKGVSSPTSEPNHPTDALSFTSHGQYGTRVFDPMDGTWIEINICDPCLIEAAQNKQVLHCSKSGAAIPFNILCGFYGLVTVED